MLTDDGGLKAFVDAPKKWAFYEAANREAGSSNQLVGTKEVSMPDPREEQEKARIESERSHPDDQGEEKVAPELPEGEHVPTRERGGRYGDGWW